MRPYLLILPTLFACHPATPMDGPLSDEADLAARLAPDGSELPQGWTSHTLVHDLDADALPDRVRIVTFDARGQRVRTQLDADGDGWFETLRTHIPFYEDGRLVAIETDEGDDGTVDGLESRTHDDDGRLISREVDGPDGYRLELTRYRTDGRRLDYQVDRDGDGAIDSEHTFLYDASGAYAGSLVARFRDGELQSETQTDYLFNGHGQVDMLIVDNPRPGDTNTVVERLYDDTGRLQSTRTDRDGDGRVDATTRYEYAADGRIRSTAQDNDLDGIADRITTHAWRGVRLHSVCP